jgi:hypothetical protein
MIIATVLVLTFKRIVIYYLLGILAVTDRHPFGGREMAAIVDVTRGRAVLRGS